MERAVCDWVEGCGSDLLRWIMNCHNDDNNTDYGNKVRWIQMGTIHSIKY